MKKIIGIIFLFICTCIPSWAQEQESTTTEPEKDKPVRTPFEGGLLIDGQTTYIHTPKSFEFVIQHKFGTMSKGLEDLLGIYAPAADIRLGLDYVVYKNVQIGWGISRRKMHNDFNLKWTILEQTRKNTIPVAVALYGVMAIDGRTKDHFNDMQYYHSSDPYSPLQKHDYRFPERISYFSELIVGRKFTEWLSLQVGASFTHYNLVPKTGDHDKIGTHFNGQLKFSPQSSFIFNCDIPLKIKKISEQREWIDPPKPNLACGLQISTSTHVFQIYVGSGEGILPQELMVFNQYDWQNKGIAFGLLITRLWN
jgi:hypothetical protein